MRRLLLFLLISASCFGQAWSGVISTSRAIDWTKAGLQPTITYGSGGSACNGTSSPGSNCTETTTNPWTPPTRVQSGSTVTCANTSGDAATINTALAAAYPGSYVLLGATTCDITGDINPISGVTLRGSGPQSTSLNLTGTTFIRAGCCTGMNNAILSATSYTAGTTSITVTGAGCGGSCTFAPSQLAYIEQCDTNYTGSGVQFGTDPNCAGSNVDNGGLWVCQATPCSVDGGTSNGYSQRQSFTITNSVNNGAGSYTLTISPGLYLSNWSSNNNATLFWVQTSIKSSAAHTYPTVGAGMEDLTINFAFNANEGMSYQGIDNWVKGVRFIGGTAGNQFSDGVGDHRLFMNNYGFFSNYNNLLSTNTEGYFFQGGGDDLALNNIIQMTQSFWGGGFSQGNVFAYNYARDGGTTYYLDVLLSHNSFTSMMLLDGNEIGYIQEDDSHGTDEPNTYFRNYFPGQDSPYYTQNSQAFQLGNYHRFENAIGNSLGSGQSTGYAGNGFGNEFNTIASDALTNASFMRWGNCDVVNAGCRFNSTEVPNSTNMPSGTYPNATAFQNATPSNNNLPCSFFISGSAFTTSPCSIKSSGGTGLSFWKVATAWSSFPTTITASTVPPYPPIGPDQSGGPYVVGTAYDNAAAVAWKNLPIDTALQNSLTITASTWSNTAATCNKTGAQTTTGLAPCEILTVTLSGIDNGSSNYVIGGFRLSGVSASCKPGSGISYTGRSDGEILMTSSSTTQIVYSLASDPGANACTGTLLYPDIRKFDESIYQADPSSLTPFVSLSPTSLAFGRQLVTTSSAGLTTTLTNTGGAIMNISSIALNTGTQFSITTNTCGSTLTASASCAVTAKFTPTTLGAKSDSIVFTTDAASSPDSVPLTGAGIPSGQVFDWNVPTSNQLCTNSNTSTGITTPAFVASFNYSSLRYWVRPTTPNGHFYKVTTTGVASTEPAWPTGAGSTVTTGGTTFTEQGATNAGECKDEFFLYVLPNIDGAALGFNASDLDPSNGGCTAQAGGGYTFSSVDSTVTGFTGATEWGAQNSVVLVLRPGTYSSSNTWTPCYWLSATYAATLSAPTNNVCFCAGYPGDKPSTTNACFTTGADTTGVPVPFDVPFNTAYNALLASYTAHLKGASYHSFINYARHGASIGGENFPFCVSQMKVAYSYSTAQMKTAWTGAVKSFADQLKAATPNYGINAGVSGLCVPGTTGCVVGYDWADLEASYYVADGFGIGSEGLTQTDINAFANNGYAAGGTAATAGTYCSNDFCYNFHANPAALPLQLQTGTASNPAGTGTGSLVNLLAFATQQQATSAEIYNQDLMIAYNPNYPQYSTYHVAYAAAIQAFRSSTPASTSVPNGIYGASKVSGQVIIQ